jgi:hypothetical protein
VQHIVPSDSKFKRTQGDVNMILTKMIDIFRRGQSVNANFDEFDDVNHQLSTSLVSQPMVRSHFHDDLFP